VGRVGVEFGACEVLGAVCQVAVGAVDHVE